MTIPQAAIDAARQVLLNEDCLDLNLDGQEHYPGCHDAVVTTALDAAMPHLRKQVAEEIRAEIRDYGEPLPYRDGVYAGLMHAARIAEGENKMRILTVRQPWAWAIIHGGKNIENRSTNIAGSYRGPVAIHAALEVAALNTEASYQIAKAVGVLSRTNSAIGNRSVPSMITDPDLPDYWVHERYGYRGAIIGVVDLTGVHSASVLNGCGYLDHDCPEHGTCRKHCSEWALGPRPGGGWFRHLELATPRPLANPIPYKGALGLRHLDDDVAQQITEGLEK